jgi:hypothetical protein
MEYEFHPLANIFPLMSEEEIDALGEDMLKHAQREPIWLYEGMILDGRNRYKACLLKGIEPRFAEYRCPDPLAFVASANLHRRHLDESQRAMIAAKLANMKRGDNQHKTEGRTSQAKAAELLDVSQRSVGRAREVIDHGVPDLVDAVERGRVPIAPAAEFAKQPKEDQAKQIAEAGSPVDAVKKADRAETKRSRSAKKSRSAEKPQPSKSKTQKALAEFKVAVDLWFKKMDDDAKREAIEYVTAKGRVTQ